MSLTHTHAKQLAFVQGKLDAAEKLAVTRRQHTYDLVKEWIVLKIDKRLNDLLEETKNYSLVEEFQMTFSRVATTEEPFEKFEDNLLSQKMLVPGQVLPDFIEFLLTCSVEDGGGEEDEYFFEVADDSWKVKSVSFEGEEGRNVNWLNVSVKFEKVVLHECCISGEYHIASQMVTNGDDWMFRGCWEAFE